MLRHHTVCGISMHSSLAVTLDGLPLGLTAIKLWTRDKFHACSALKKKVNPTRVPIEKKESIRWLENVRQSTGLLNDPEHCVHIGDRESDIYELFCTAHQLGRGKVSCPRLCWRFDIAALWFVRRLASRSSILNWI